MLRNPLAEIISDPKAEFKASVLSSNPFLVSGSVTQDTHSSSQLSPWILLEEAVGTDGCLFKKGVRQSRREKKKRVEKVVRSKFSWATTLVAMRMNANGLELFTCNPVGRVSAQWPFVVSLWSRKSH